MSFPDEPHWARAISGGLASMTAEAFTLPMDSIKVRLQLQGSLDAKQPRVGALDCVKRIIRDETVWALWKGLRPALLRQAVYSTARMALYAPIRNALGDSSSLWNKILAGGTGGMLGAIVASPCDLVKVRMQADVAGTRYRAGVLSAFADIVRTEGPQTLFRGLIPNMQRAFIVNAAELATYDHAKQLLIEHEIMKEGVPAHGVASFMAGFVAAVCSVPVDTMKTRLMNQPYIDGRGKYYSGMVDCLRKTVKNEGMPALYNGFFATWMRIGPWAMVMFMCFEQYRMLAKEYLY